LCFENKDKLESELPKLIQIESWRVKKRRFGNQQSARGRGGDLPSLWVRMASDNIDRDEESWPFCLDDEGPNQNKFSVQCSLPNSSTLIEQYQMRG